jgi:D-ribose pyranase
MKKIGVLNKDISEVIAGMGHGDMLVVSDAGLAIPSTVRRIDVAIKPGLPGLIETAEVVNLELKVDQIIVPEMMETACPQILEELRKLFTGVKLEKVPTEHYKQLAWSSRAIIRTGECTPYANVILVSGVIF